MKPSAPQAEPGTYPGFTIRVAKTDGVVLEALSDSNQYPSVNRHMVSMVQGTLLICESLSVPEALTKNRIPQIHRLLWQQLAQRDVRRSLPNSQSRPIKLTFPAEERKRIIDTSRQLRWAAGQVIVEALQAYCILAGTDGLLEHLPDIIRLSRANRSLLGESEPESAGFILGCLNLGLGQISRPKLDSGPVEPPQMEVDLDLL